MIYCPNCHKPLSECECDKVPLAEIPPRVIFDPETLTFKEVDPADFVVMNDG